MGNISEVVDVSITRETKAVARDAFGTLLVAGDSAKLPKNDVTVLTFDADLVASNQFDAKVNNVAITPVVYATSSDATMDAIAAEFQSKASIATAVATGSPKRVITITAAGDETAPVVITEEAVTLGGSQAGITKARTPAVRTKEYANIEAVAVDFATTDPEYIAAAALFAQNPNPGVIKIGRVDSGEDWSDAMDAIETFDPDWYALVITERTQSDVLDVVAWVETGARHLFFTADDDVNILDAGVSSDLASVLQTAARDRSIVFFHEDAGTTYPEAAWVGDGFAKDPGSVTMAFRELTDVNANILTTTQSNAARNKGANTFETIGGRTVMRDGTVASGEYIDVMRDSDWLKTQLEEGVFTLLAASDKVPYTDAGISTVEGVVRQKLDDAIAAGFLAARPDLYAGQPYSVTVPASADVSQADKAARILRNVDFTATIAGAIHKVIITGRVAV
jgi:hypothetical protein